MLQYSWNQNRHTGDLAEHRILRAEGKTYPQTCFSHIEHSGNYIYRLISHTTTPHSAHTVYLCVPYGSHSKQRLFPQTALTGLAL
jgi:hypothetical protein